MTTVDQIRKAKQALYNIGMDSNVTDLDREKIREFLGVLQLIESRILFGKGKVVPF